MASKKLTKEQLLKIIMSKKSELEDFSLDELNEAVEFLFKQVNIIADEIKERPCKHCAN